MKTFLSVVGGSLGVLVGMNLQTFAGIGIEAVIGFFTVRLLLEKIKNEREKRQNNLDCDRCNRLAIKLLYNKESSENGQAEKQ